MKLPGLSALARLALALVAALLIAVLMRDMVEALIVRPLAYIFWLLGLVYRVIPQPVLWLILVATLLYLTISSFASQMEWPGPRRFGRMARRGPVSELANQITHRNAGVYFKWQIARTMGEIAMDLQELREHTRSRKLKLGNLDQKDGTRKYLQAGLSTSFSDYPLGRSIFSKVKTPFDGDIEPVITYLEHELEHEDDQ